MITNNLEGQQPFSKAQGSNIEQNTSLCNPQENTKKIINWDESQKSAFIVFHISYFLQYPLKIISFNKPHSRNSLTKKVSSFMEKQLGQQLSKTSQQCKSRYSMIQRQNRNRRGYDFIDYIIQKAKKICSSADYHQKHILQRKIVQLQQLLTKDSQLMVNTKKIAAFEANFQVCQKNNNIHRFLLEAGINMKDLF